MLDVTHSQVDVETNFGGVSLKGGSHFFSLPYRKIYMTLSRSLAKCC